VEPPGGTGLAARRRIAYTQFLGFLDEGPGNDEHSPGDANHFVSIFMILGFWVDSDRGKASVNC